MDDTMERLVRSLKRSGFNCNLFEHFNLLDFDLAARNSDAMCYLVKMLSNVDSIRERNAARLKLTAKATESKPVIIGERTKAGELEDGVIYERYHIETMTQKTFDMMLNKKEVFAVEVNGRKLAHIDSDKLMRKRAELDLSRAELASLLGTTKESIYNYENDLCLAGEDIARKINEFFKEEMRTPFTLEKQEEKEEEDADSEIAKMYKELGFDVTSIPHSMADVIAKRKDIIMNTLAETQSKMYRYCELLERVSKIFDSYPVFISSKYNKENFKGVPVLSPEELKELETAREIIRIIKERRG